MGTTRVKNEIISLNTYQWINQVQEYSGTHIFLTYGSKHIIDHISIAFNLKGIDTKVSGGYFKCLREFEW